MQAEIYPPCPISLRKCITQVTSPSHVRRTPLLHSTNDTFPPNHTQTHFLQALSSPRHHAAPTSRNILFPCLLTTPSIIALTCLHPSTPTANIPSTRPTCTLLSSTQTPTLSPPPTV